MDAELAGAVPSLPFGLTSTCWALAATGLPLIPAMKVAFWLAAVPIRIFPDSPSTPRLAM